MKKRKKTDSAAKKRVECNYTCDRHLQPSKHKHKARVIKGEKGHEKVINNVWQICLLMQSL